MDKERRIRERAHQLWVREGKPEGHAWDHWFRAAREIEPEKRAGERDAGHNEVRAANIYVHRGPYFGGSPPGFDLADGLHTPGVPSKPPERKG